MDVAGTPIPPPLASCSSVSASIACPFDRCASALLAAGARPRVAAPHRRADRGAGCGDVARAAGSRDARAATAWRRWERRDRARRDRRRRAGRRHGDPLRLAGQGARTRARGPRAELPRPQARRPDALGRRHHADDELRDARRAGRGGARDRHPPGAAARVAAARRRRRALPRRRGQALAARARARRPRRRAAALGRARALPAAGVRTLFVCNVDNVGATLDPAMAGLHQELGGEITAELVSKRPGDAGGVPVRRADGSLALAEAFRVPEDFPHEQFPLFNTNTLWIDIAALEAPPTTPGAWRARAWTSARRSSSSGSSASSRGGILALRPRPARGRRIAFRARQGRGRLAAAQEQIAAIARERLALDI